MTPDPDDPQVWWQMLVRAVAGLQRGSTEQATEYLRFTEQHRGRAVAEQARPRLRELQHAKNWQGCSAWIPNGFKPTKQGKP